MPILRGAGFRSKRVYLRQRHVRAVAGGPVDAIDGGHVCPIDGAEVRLEQLDTAFDVEPTATLEPRKLARGPARTLRSSLWVCLALVAVVVVLWVLNTIL
jgi:hypothetical protein